MPEKRDFLWMTLLVLIFAVGLGLRLYHLSDPPLDFHPTRQLHSALIARGMYYDGRSDVPAWQRDAAVAQWRAEGVIEPQVFERLAAWTYNFAGAVDLAIPRLYSIFFWMAGAVFLAWLAADWIGWVGALVAALFFLVWPYGVIASRAFQPDPLMVALVVVALWCASRWQRRRTWGWAIAAGLSAGFAIYIKSTAVFFLAPALIVLSVTLILEKELFTPENKKQNRSAVSVMKSLFIHPQVWAVALLAVLPYALYLIDGLWIRGGLAGQFAQRFFPQMWLDPAFYLRWIGNLGRAVPFEMALVALLGVLLLPRPEHRWTLLALWAGYFLMGMTLPHHISTHDYYHLPLFPVVALGLGAVGETLLHNLPSPRWLARSALAAALLAALVMEGYSARTALKRSDAAAQAQMWAAIGHDLGPSASVVALVPDYGAALEYWGWITPATWLTSADIRWQESLGENFDVRAEFSGLAEGKDFFLVTELADLDLQPELKQLLDADYPLYRQSKDYVIYDLRPGS